MAFETMTDEDLLAQASKHEQDIDALHTQRRTIMQEWDARQHAKVAWIHFPDLEPDDAVKRLDAFEALRDTPGLLQMTPEQVVARGAELGLAPHHIAGHIGLLGLTETDDDGQPVQSDLQGGVAHIATIQMNVRPQGGTHG